MERNISGIVARFGGQNKLAEALGVGQSAIGNWASRGIPRCRHLELLRLARKLGVELGEEELLASAGKLVGGE